MTLALDAFDEKRSSSLKESIERYGHQTSTPPPSTTMVCPVA